MTRTPPAAARPASAPVEAPVRGILLCCAAILLFVTMSAIVKYLAPHYPAPQIVWARYCAHFVFILLIVPHRIPTLLVSRRKGLQVLRGLLMLTSTACSFVALRYLPMADISAIVFLAPLLTTALSVLMLDERVGPRRWTAVGIGFVGMLLIVRPGFGAMHWAALLPLAMAFLHALYGILTRMVRGDADPMNALFYTALVGVVLASIPAPFFWVPPDFAGWALLISLGVLGGIGHYLLIIAFRNAGASVLAPFSYTDLIWAVILGYAVFGDFPDTWTFAGAGVIVASGLYVLHRERVRKGAG